MSLKRDRSALTQRFFTPTKAAIQSEPVPNNTSLILAAHKVILGGLQICEQVCAEQQVEVEQPTGRLQSSTKGLRTKFIISKHAIGKCGRYFSTY